MNSPSNVIAALKPPTLVLVITVLSALLTSSLNAQQAGAKGGDKEVVQLDPFLVPSDKDEGYSTKYTTIATRSVKSLMDVPTMIGVANQELIRDLSAVNGHQAIQYAVSGVVQNQTTWDDSFIRGFRSVNALRDGIVTSLRRRNPMYDIDRIEVIKGPTGMVLGNVTYLGGAINFVTKSPTDKPQGSVKVTAGVPEYFRVEANASGPLRKRDGDTRVNYRVTLGSTQGQPEKDMESFDEIFVSGGLEMKYKDIVRFDTRLAHYVDDGYLYWSDFLDPIKSVNGGPAVLHPQSTESFSVARPDQVEMSNTWLYWNNSLNVKMSELSNFNLTHAYYALDNEWHVIGGFAQKGRSLATTGTLPIRLIETIGDEYSHVVNAQYLHRLIGNSWQNDLQIGTDFRWEFSKGASKTTSSGELNPANPNYNVIIPWQLDASAYETGNKSRGQLGEYWFQDNVTLFDNKLILVGGLRWTKTSVTATNGVTNTTTRTETPETKTHRYGIIYKPTENFSIYAVNARNLNPIITIDEEGNPFHDQKGNQLEVGVKWSKHTNPLDYFITVAYFDQELTNPYATGFSERLNKTITIQLPKPDYSKGVEAELKGRLNFASGFADFSVNIFNADLYASALDKIPQENPETIFSAFAKYAWTSGPLKGLTVGGGFHDESKKFTVRHLYTQNNPMTFTAMARYVVNARWSLQLNGNNITDERYLIKAQTLELAQTAPGAEYKLSVYYNW